MIAATLTPQAALRAVLIDRIGQELFHGDVLDGNTERSATWEGTTDYERELFRADARAARRRRDAVAMAAAQLKARQAAEKALPDAARALLTEDGRKALYALVDAVIAAHYAQLSYGRPEPELRAFEQMHEIPTPREFTVIEGGRQIESAQESEGAFVSGRDMGDESDRHHHDRRLGHPVESAIHHHEREL